MKFSSKFHKGDWPDQASVENVYILKLAHDQLRK